MQRYGRLRSIVVAVAVFPKFPSIHNNHCDIFFVNLELSKQNNVMKI